MINRQWRVRRLLEPGEALDGGCLELVEREVPAPADGEFLARTLYLGTSPAQRSYVTRAESMHDKVAPGEVMRGRGLARVVESRHAGWRPGDLVVAATGWQEWSVQRAGASGILGLQRLGEPLRPLSTSLGILGNAGLTAYFGLFDVGRMRAGDTVVVSAAAGGVGSVVGQLARIAGARRVVGIAGGPEKCAWLTDTVGYDAAIDYKAGDVEARLAALCPEGIDVFFDNVGGDILEAALGRLAIGARVVVCGFISTDYLGGGVQGPARYVNLVRRRATMAGFFVFDYAHRHAEAGERLRAWYRSGELVATEDVVDGLERMPEALAGLFTGANRGIRLCRVDPEAETDRCESGAVASAN